jgi:type 1 glutamine amidotransferase
MPPRVLVVGETTFPFHDIEEKRSQFEAVLDAFDVTVTTDRSAVAALGPGDVLVDYVTDSTAGEYPTLVADHVAAGGGYVGVHCAADLTSTAADDPDDLIDSRDEPVPELRDLLGGHFLTHPDQAEFGVEITATHPITDGVADFRVFDEPYQVTVDDDVTVLARMDHPDFEDYPVVWTAPTDAGRVAYVSIGHTDEALEDPSFARLLENSVWWASDAAE